MGIESSAPLGKQRDWREGSTESRAGTFLLKDAKRVVGDARRFLEYYYVLLYTNLDVYYAKCRAQCGNCQNLLSKY